MRETIDTRTEDDELVAQGLFDIVDYILDNNLEIRVVVY